MEYVKYCLHNKALPSICGEQPVALAITWNIWQYLQGPFGQQLN